MNQSFKFFLNKIKYAQKLSLTSQSLVNSILNHPLRVAYSTRSKNVLRNRYPFRNKDGSFKEYNETITIVPKEYEEQGNFFKTEIHIKRPIYCFILKVEIQFDYLSIN